MKTIDNINVISTKKGDHGTSKNFSNESLPKTDILFDVVGTIDELTSFLGVTYHYVEEKDLIKKIQSTLQRIMSVVATNPDSKQYDTLNHIKEKDILYIEYYEELFLKDASIKPVFVLPGSDSTKGSSYLDYSRSVTRRCERVMLKFVVEHDRDDLVLCNKYLNRLSDLLYILARTYD